MTERERWIVYPLLFLALGAALRDKLFDRTLSRDIVCEQLWLVDGDGGGNQLPLGKLGKGPAPLQKGGQLTIDVVRAGTVIADNYSYQGMPFVPTLRLVPSLLKALESAAEKQEAAAKRGAAAKQGEPPAANQRQQDDVESP
jgi:hypothetical protein